MDENKARTIYHLTEEVHNDTTEIYELLMDEENEDAIKKIDILRRKLKELKDNVIKRDDL